VGGPRTPRDEARKQLPVKSLLWNSSPNFAADSSAPVAYASAMARVGVNEVENGRRVRIVDRERSPPWST
jgi:hypothetical protein